MDTRTHAMSNTSGPFVIVKKCVVLLPRGSDDYPKSVVPSRIEQSGWRDIVDADRIEAVSRNGREFALDDWLRAVLTSVLGTEGDLGNSAHVKLFVVDEDEFARGRTPAVGAVKMC